MKPCKSTSANSHNASNISSSQNEDDSSTSESDLECANVVAKSFHTTPSIPLNIFSEPATSTTIGSIALRECNQVTFGNQNIYQGPITVMYDNNTVIPAANTKPSESKNQYGSGVRTQLDKFWLSKRRKLISIALISTILLAGIVTISFGAAIKNNENSLDLDLESEADKFKIIRRHEWLARPPSKDPIYLDLPAKRVIIAHTATMNCTTQESCSSYIRSCQNYHMDEMDFGDIGYNFLVGGDGNAYEGCGWSKQGAHTYGYNRGSICIAFIGTFSKVQPPMRQLIAAEKLIEKGVKLKKLASDYRVFGHRQLIAIDSPGIELYKIIENWPHWSANISK